MKFLITVCFVCLLSAHVGAQSFLPNTEDIPQMPGLTQVEEVASFDNPQEKMVIINAVSTKSISEIQKFYQTNLQNLGWSKIKKNTFKRGQDTFYIEIKKASQQTQIQFILTQE